MRSVCRKSILYCLLILICLLIAGCAGAPAARDDHPAVEKIPEEEMIAAEEIAPADKQEAGSAPAAAAVSGRIPISSRAIFVGDSRTIDLFADSDEEIPGGNRDGITVFALHGANYEYLQRILRNYDPGSYDMLISWMGANDRGEFERYRPMYESVLAAGKSLMLLTVGPSDDASLKNDDTLYYTDALITGFNASLTAWASAHGVPVIDLYTYIKNSPTVTADPADGIHYLPRPTSEVWQYFLSCTDR